MAHSLRTAWFPYAQYWQLTRFQIEHFVDGDFAAAELISNLVLVVRVDKVIYLVIHPIFLKRNASDRVSMGISDERRTKFWNWDNERLAILPEVGG